LLKRHGFRTQSVTEIKGSTEERIEQILNVIGS
jgi:hypothetical protein